MAKIALRASGVGTSAHTLVEDLAALLRKEIAEVEVALDDAAPGASEQGDASSPQVVDRETYARLFPERAPFLPPDPPDFRSEYFIGRAPLAARRRLKWEEIIHVILPFAGGYAFNHAMDLLVHWARTRWRPETRESSRGSRKIYVYGPDGKVLRTIDMKSLDDDESGEPGP